MKINPLFAIVLSLLALRVNAAEPQTQQLSATGNVIDDRLACSADIQNTALVFPDAIDVSDLPTRDDLQYENLMIHPQTYPVVLVSGCSVGQKYTISMTGTSYKNTYIVNKTGEGFAKNVGVETYYNDPHGHSGSYLLDPTHPSIPLEVNSDGTNGEGIILQVGLASTAESKSAPIDEQATPGKVDISAQIEIDYL